MSDKVRNFKQRLLTVQTELKAPKGQMNKFGGYKYRSCEDIVEALKPHLKTAGMILKMEDEIVEVAGRIYVKATVSVKDTEGEETESSSAFAREANQKKKMDEAQVTGAASSYARKYALCGLFGIDDGNDPDSMNRHEDSPRNAGKPVNNGFKQGKPNAPSEKQLQFLGQLYLQGGLSEGEAQKYVNEARKRTAKEVSEIIENAKARLAEKEAEKEYVPTVEDVE